MESTDFLNTRVVIIGGSSGMGLAIAQAVAERGGEVVICGRSQEKLDSASKTIDGKVSTAQLDISDTQAVQAFFEAQPPFDHLITPGAHIASGPFIDFPLETAKKGFEVKFWGQYFAARCSCSKIREGGSILFVSGIYGRRPSAGVSMMAAVNGAVEGLARALSIELGPAIRVNVLSPGLIQTPLIEALPAERKERLYQEFSEKTALKRVGKPQEAALGALYLMRSTYATGTTLFVDGGFVFN